MTMSSMQWKRHREVNPLAVRTQQGKIELGAFLRSVHSPDCVWKMIRVLDPNAEHQHDLTVTSVGIEIDGDLDLDRLNLIG